MQPVLFVSQNPNEGNGTFTTEFNRLWMRFSVHFIGVFFLKWVTFECQIFFYFFRPSQATQPCFKKKKSNHNDDCFN